MMALDQVMSEERPGRCYGCGDTMIGSMLDQATLWSPGTKRGRDPDGWAEPEEDRANDDADSANTAPSRKRRRLQASFGMDATTPVGVTSYKDYSVCSSLSSTGGKVHAAPWRSGAGTMSSFGGYPGNHFSGDDSYQEGEEEEDQEDHVGSELLSRVLFGMTLESRSEAEQDEYGETMTSAQPPTFFPVNHKRLPRPLRWGRIMMCLLSLLAMAKWSFALLQPPMGKVAIASHVIPNGGKVSDVTLRQFLTHPDGFSLGMAPAFFGFYGYFGSLAAWEESVSSNLLQPGGRLRQVAGASAGAMAAILLAAGVSPLKAADFCTKVSLSDFADFPGALAVFRGNKFERIMEDILARESPCLSLLLEDAMLPVAVSAFDLQSMAGQILTSGSMARAARASATFPFMFQPVGWDNGKVDYTLVDGGIADPNGVAGLHGRNPGRVVNLKINPFWNVPPPPSEIPGSTEVVSISLQNLPQPKPWAMELGPKAVAAAAAAMKASLDIPLHYGQEENHYELHIDASRFWSKD